MAGSSAALSHACIYCNNPHEVSEYQDLRSLSEEARKSYVLKMGLCFGCLGRSHVAKSCNQRKQCALCKGRHPTALHRAPPFTGANSTSANHISNDQGPVYGGKLNVLPVQVHFEGKTVRTNAFFDTGSTHSFCCSSLLQKLNYHPDESTVLQLNTVNNRQNVKSHIVRGIKITNLSGFEEMVLPPLFTFNEIPINPTDIPRDHDSTSHLRKQGVYIRTIQGPIELLLGGNAALAMEPLQVIRSENGGPFAIRTRFGWVLGGAKLSRQVAKLNKIQVQQNWESVNGILASAETVYFLPAIR